MKKIVFLLILIFSLYSFAFSQENYIAVLPFTGGYAGEGDTIARLLGSELVKASKGRFDIVQRTSAINAVLDEHKFQTRGITDTDTISDVSKIANAQYVVTGHIIQKLGNKRLVVASITEGKSLNQTAGYYSYYLDLGEMRAKLSLMAKTLIENTLNKNEDAPTLAVMPFYIVAPDEASINDAEVLAQILTCSLANSGKYNVLVRTTSTVKKIMEELNIQESGLTDRENIKIIGKALNAEYVLSGFVSKLGSDSYIDIEIMDTETGLQKVGADVIYENIGDGVNIIPELSYRLTGVGRNKAGVGTLELLLEKNEGKEGIYEIKSLASGGINARDRDGCTALMLASKYGYADIARALITAGADVNAKNEHFGNRNALIYASSQGHTEVVKVLIDGGADVNAKGSIGNWPTALMMASGKGYVDIVTVLIEGGADVNIKNKRFLTALDIAYDNGHRKIVNMLKRAGAY